MKDNYLIVSVEDRHSLRWRCKWPNPSVVVGISGQEDSCVAFPAQAWNSSFRLDVFWTLCVNAYLWCVCVCKTCCSLAGLINGSITIAPGNFHQERHRAPAGEVICVVHQCISHGFIAHQDHSPLGPQGHGQHRAVFLTELKVTKTFKSFQTGQKGK